MVIAPRLLHVKQVAEILQKSESKIYDLIRDGELRAHSERPGKKGLRVIAESVDSYIERYEIPAEDWLL